MEYSDTLNKIYNIIEAERVYNEQVKKLKDLEYLTKLAEKEWFRQVVTYTTRYDIMPAVLGEAFDEFYDKGKKKKNALEMLTKAINEDFFDGKISDFKIANLMWYGIHKEYLEVYFDYGGCTYILNIPIKSHLSLDNRKYYDGRFHFTVKDSEYSLTRLYSSYTIEEMKKYIIKEIVKESQNEA